MPLISPTGPLQAKSKALLPLISPIGPLSEESKALVPLISPFCPLSAKSRALVPLISPSGPLQAKSRALLPLISPSGPLSAKSKALVPLISPTGPLSAKSKAFLPLISPSCPLSAESKAFVPLILWHQAPHPLCPWHSSGRFSGLVASRFPCPQPPLPACLPSGQTTYPLLSPPACRLPNNPPLPLPANPTTACLFSSLTGSQNTRHKRGYFRTSCSYSVGVTPKRFLKLLLK